MFGKKKTLLPHDSIKSCNIGSNWKLIFLFQVFAIKPKFEERTIFFLREIAVPGLCTLYIAQWSLKTV